MDRGKNRKIKSKNTCRLRQRQFNEWRKVGTEVMHNHPLPPTIRTNFQPFCKKQLPWKRNAPSYIAEHGNIRYGISLWPFGVKCSSCVPSQLLVNPQCTFCGEVGSEGEKEKHPKYWCFIKFALLTNPEHNSIWTTTKQVNSITARPSTVTKPFASQSFSRL